MSHRTHLRTQALGPARAHALERIEDLVGMIDYWPRRVRNIILKETTIVKAERFTLMLYLLGNGMPPKIACQSLLDMKLLRDKSAFLHVKSICKDFRTGSGASKYKFYHTHLGKTLPFQAPSTVSNISHFWEQ